MVFRPLVAALVLLVPALLLIQAQAQEDALPPVSSLCDDGSHQTILRRRPGVPADTYKLPPCGTPGTEGQLAPYTDPMDLGPPVPDRWRIVEQIGIRTNLWNPYKAHNPIKGDLPLWGGDWFVNLTGTSDTTLESTQFPLSMGIASTARPDSLGTAGYGKSMVFAENLILNAEVYRGDTTFRPPDWKFRFTPVININRTHVRERGVLNAAPDPGGDISHTRHDVFVGIQSLFVEKHLRDVSPRYDFDSLRVGIQPFSTDFRGFLFQDQPLGIRLFGTRHNNIFQYNLAWFRLLEKDTNSGLNEVVMRPRDDDVFIANLYWQDFPILGYTSQVTAVYNRDREAGQNHRDKNGILVRPTALPGERTRNYDVTYFGYNGNGHFGRLNVTASLYYAVGKQDSARIPGQVDRIRAGFAAAEFSWDFDWLRPRLSLLWASADKNPYDNRATGFDAIFENPQFAGADTSLFIHQAIPLISGAGTVLSGRNGILPTLRSSKEQGQSNFINPGLRLIGLGFDADLYPQLRLSGNWNYLAFDKTRVLEALLPQALIAKPIAKSIGQDISVSLIWRPFMSQNVVVRLSGARLLPGAGFRDLYGDDTNQPYSVLADVILTY